MSSQPPWETQIQPGWGSQPSPEQPQQPPHQQPQQGGGWNQGSYQPPLQMPPVPPQQDQVPYPYAQQPQPPQQDRGPYPYSQPPQQDTPPYPQFPMQPPPPQFTPPQMPGMPGPGEEPPPRRNTGRVVAGIAAVVVLAGAAGGVYLATKGGGKTDTKAQTTAATTSASSSSAPASSSPASSSSASFPNNSYTSSPAVPPASAASPGGGATLDNAATDKTPFTPDALVAKSFTDDKNVAYALKFAQPQPCDKIGDAAVQTIVKSAKCTDFMAASWIDPGNRIVVSAMVIPYQDAATASGIYKKLSATHTGDYAQWCPPAGQPGADACAKLAKAGAVTREGKFGSFHRYVLITTAVYVDLRNDDSQKDWLIAAAHGAFQNTLPGQ